MAPYKGWARLGGRRLGCVAALLRLEYPTHKTEFMVSKFFPARSNCTRGASRSPSGPVQLDQPFSAPGQRKMNRPSSPLKGYDKKNCPAHLHHFWQRDNQALYLGNKSVAGAKLRGSSLVFV